DNGQIDLLLQALVPHSPTSGDARRYAEYLRRNAARMRYDVFRQLGLCTSTGVIEAGCKVAVGARLKGSGMRWTVRGANAEWRCAAGSSAAALTFFGNLGRRAGPGFRRSGAPQN